MLAVSPEVFDEHMEILQRYAFLYDELIRAESGDREIDFGRLV